MNFVKGYFTNSHDKTENGDHSYDPHNVSQPFCGWDLFGIMRILRNFCLML